MGAFTRGGLGVGVRGSPSPSATNPGFPPHFPPLPPGGRGAPAAVRGAEGAAGSGAAPAPGTVPGAEGAAGSGVTPVPPPATPPPALSEVLAGRGGRGAARRLATPSALPSPFPIDFWIIKRLRRCEASLSIAASPPPAGSPRVPPQPRAAAGPGKGGVAG